MRTLILFLATLLLGGCQPASPPGGEAPQAAGETSRAAAEPPAAPDGRPMIVAFGDSLTAGFGMPPGKSYPDYLQRELDRQGYAYRVVNEGVSGDTSSAGVVRTENVLALEPEFVIVCFGGNDGLRGLSVESMESNLRQIIRRLQQGGARVVLGGMKLPPNYGREYVEAFESVYPRLARDLNVALIPFLLEGVAARPELLYDEIHPNEEGNRLVALNVLEVLEPLLARAPGK